MKHLDITQDIYETREDILLAFDQFTPTGQALPTHRLIPAPFEGAIEYREEGSIQGLRAIVYYLFEEHEHAGAEEDSLPFDEDHITRIENTGDPENY